MAKSIICLGRGGLGKCFESRGIVCYDRNSVDVNDIWQINSIFNENKPKYVINCTGIVGTGKCDNNPEMAYMVNVGGISNIVYMCLKHNIKLIHFSTFYIGDYNIYTRSKMIAEKIVSDSNISSFIVRLPWMFGKFTDNFIFSAIKGKDVSIYDDEFGYLSYDDDVVDYVIDNIDSKGLISLANDGLVSRRDILSYIGCSFTKMDRTSNMPETSPRPDVILRNWKLPMKEFINGFRSV